MKFVAGLVSLPAIVMSLFITHELLEFMSADRLLWTLYWTMIPMVIFTTMINKFIDD